MAETFYTLLTTIGKAQFANSTALGTKINFKTLKVGDGNGAYYNPTEDQADLVNAKWTGNINSVSVDTDNPSWIVLETMIPSDVGGFTIREYGAFDENGNMLAIAKCAETYKPVISDGSTKELLIKMVLAVTNTENVTLKIDPTIIFAKKADVELVQTQVNDLKNKSNIYTTTNVGNAYSVTVPNLTTLTDGYPLTVKFNVASTGAITVNPNNLGAKAVVDYFGNPVTNVRQNLIANLRYETSAGNFQLLGKGGGGTAIANKILSPYSATVDSGQIIGTIPSKTAQTYNPSTSTQTIVSGQYLSGTQTINPVTGNANVPQVLSGYTFASSSGIGLIGTMPNHSGTDSPANSITGTGAGRIYVRPQYGYYDGSVASYVDDTNFIASNIISGKSIFGLVGSAPKYAIGTVAVPTGSGATIYTGFTPVTVMVTRTDTALDYTAPLEVTIQNGWERTTSYRSAGYFYSSLFEMVDAPTYCTTSISSTGLSLNSLYGGWTYNYVILG